MPRGDVHINSTESFSPMIERVKWGVFHYMSRKHLSRYLTEIEFRWNHCTSEEKITKKFNQLVSQLSQFKGVRKKETLHHRVDW